MPRTVLVTGSSGFLGSRVVAALRAAGDDVRGVDLRPSATTDLAADLLVEGPWQAAAAAADVVVHTAALVGEKGARERFAALNVDGTRRVLAAAGGRVVHVSSIVVHGSDFAGDVDEDGPVRPTGNPYTDTKIAAEHLALAGAARGQRVAVVRPGDVYGPGSLQWTVRPVELLRAGRLVVPSTGVLSPTYVDDVVDGIVRAVSADAADGQVLHLAGPPVPAAEFFRGYQAVVGGRVRVLPTRALRALAAPLDLLGDRAPFSSRTLEYVTHPGGYSSRRAAEVLGWRPQVDLAEGMRRTAEWLRAQAD